MSPILSRRTLLAFAAVAAAPDPAHAAHAAWPVLLAEEWAAFRRRFLMAEGRVLDTGRGGVSHSEGQSYAMLLAGAAGDRASFDAAWGWARRHLARPRDHLLSWRWVPGGGVTDRNNATDGDLVAAWALLRAHRLWGEAAHLAAARAIATDILNHCTIRFADGTWLLPGAFGFRHPDRVVLNLSYYAWAAMEALEAAVPDPRWAALRKDGLDLLGRARFGRWRLTPDWVEISREGALQPAREWPARSSADAVRVPLHLAWAGLRPDLLKAFQTAWSAGAAGWVDLSAGAPAPQAAGAGAAAIARLVRARLGRALPGSWPPAPHQGTQYYDAALSLLALLAMMESEPPPAASPPRRHAPAGDMLVRAVQPGPRVAPPRWTRGPDD